MTDQQLLSATQKLQAYKDALVPGGDPRAARTAFEEAVAPLRGTPKGDALWNLKLQLDAAFAHNAFDAFGKLVDTGFASVGSAFDLGKQMAQQGQKSLFFPTAASELARVAGVITELKKAADQLKAVDIAALAASFKKGDIAGLMDQTDQITTLLQQLGAKLTTVKAAMPT